MATVKKVRKQRSKERKNVVDGRAYISASFNNTIITITDLMGGVISWATAGGCGFRGSRKSTPHAAKVAADKAALVAHDMGMRNVEIYVKGPGPGRDSAIRALADQFKLTSLVDRTGVPHNGCQPPKERRV